MENKFPHSEDFLLRQLQNGDRKCFEEIFNTYWDLLYKTAYRKVNSYDEAEELVQAVFVELWEKRSETRILNLSAYLNTTLRNKFIDHIRKAAVRSKYADYCHSFSECMHESNMDTVLYNELSDQFKQGLEKMPEKYREVFIMSRLEGLQLADIANRIKLSEKAVQYHLTKALKFLRVYLKDYILLLLALLH
ncbi:RNA polymerase sigma-70 factor (plasmid) [Spirosoma sp. SC4-14]|uniref:RNA polymerase sigma factor n=1 Tax=Spirosoma sp. SC4-14 TaxID=3128900 RepID=UPI0030D45311